MRITESLALLALVALPGMATAQHTKAAPGRVAAIAPPPPPPPTRYDDGYGRGYGQQARGTVIVTPDGTVIVTGRRGHGERGRECVVPNGYGSAYGQAAATYPSQPVVGVSQPTVYQPQPGVAQPMPYTPPVPNEQTASQQMANPQAQSGAAAYGRCW